MRSFFILARFLKDQWRASLSHLLGQLCARCSPRVVGFPVVSISGVRWRVWCSSGGVLFSREKIAQRLTIVRAMVSSILAVFLEGKNLQPFARTRWPWPGAARLTALTCRLGFGRPRSASWVPARARSMLPSLCLCNCLRLPRLTLAGSAHLLHCLGRLVLVSKLEGFTISQKRGGALFATPTKLHAVQLWRL